MVVPIAAVLCSEHPGRASSDALGRALRQRGPQRAALHVVSSPGTGMVPGMGAWDCSHRMGSPSPLQEPWGRLSFCPGHRADLSFPFFLIMGMGRTR